MVTRQSDTRLERAPALGVRDDRRIATLGELLVPAGVGVNGRQPWDVRIRDSRALDHIFRRGSLGAGEAWMRGWWDTDALDETIRRVLAAGVSRRLRSGGGLRLLLRAWLSNPQRLTRAFEVGEAHYDLGNDLFAEMLDSRMVYSCAYWRNAKTLEEAQEHKLDLICRKLDLAPGQRLLDIGCGWGSLCRFAAENYGVEVLGITVSAEQQRLAAERCAGLPVEIRLQDYRRLGGEGRRFDRVVSVGMFEHVGVRNYRAFFDTARDCLRPQGLFLLHTIGRNVTSATTDPWIERYIFPRGQLPSLRQVTTASEGRFVIEDLHNFGSDYDRTLMAWHERFENAWPRLEARYGPTFRRMWKYYLLSCAGAFRARELQLWQFVMSPVGVAGGYVRTGT